MELLVSTHPKQYSSSVGSPCNQCARYRNTKSEPNIRTQTQAQDFEPASHLPYVLLVALKGTNFCSNILKLNLDAFP